MPFDFFPRFQRTSNYIHNAIKVFDKKLSQLFLVARKKGKIRCCAKSCNLFHGRILKTLDARSSGRSVPLRKKTVP